MGEAMRISVTDDTIGDHFEGIMISVTDPFEDKHWVPGWKCLHCNWRIGTFGLPRAHDCPEEGKKQRIRHDEAQQAQR